MLRNLGSYLSNVLKDVDNVYSSKRLVVLLAMVSLTTAFFSNLFFDSTIDQFIFDGMMYIVVAGLGIVGAEKFSPSAKKREPNGND